MEIIVYIFGYLFLIIISFFFLILLFEFLFKVSNFLLDKFIYKTVTRRDFLHENYHKYLNWIENVEAPMFNYIPIGIKYHNDKILKKFSKINSLGFRDEDFDKIDKKNMNIILFGSSAAWGFGASNENNVISKHLENQINKNIGLFSKKKKCKVWNFGQVDGRISQDLINILFFSKKIKPEIIIGFNGWNEIASSSIFKKMLLTKWGFFYLDELKDWENVNYSKKDTYYLIKDIIRWLTKRSRIMSYLKNYSEPAIKMEDRIEIGTQTFVDNVEMMKYLTKGYGSKYYQFLQPHIYRKKYLVKSEKLVQEMYDNYRPIEGGKKFSNFLKKNNMYDKFKKKISSKVEIEDLSDLFLHDKKHCFYSLVHCTDYGYKKVAQEIYSKIKSKIRK